METYKEYKDRKFFFALAANASPFSSSRAEFEKFLSLWKDADPGIAEVEDAQKRLAGLKS